MHYYGKIHSKLPIFRVKSVKFTPAKKNLHENSRGSLDKYEVWQCDADNEDGNNGDGEDLDGRAMKMVMRG